jgi:hypothetical protein
MINRRNILGFAAAFVIAGCTPPLIEESVSKGMRVDSISVDVSNLTKGVTGRQFTVSNDKVKADILAALNSEIKTTTSGPRPVALRIQVDTFRLVSPGQSAFLGGISTITGRAAVVDTKTKEVIVPETKVFGTGKGYAPGGLIGALSTKKPAEDYKTTVTGFADDVIMRVFGQ